MNDYHSDDDHGAMFAISQTQPEDPETPLGKMKQPPPTPGFQTRCELHSFMIDCIVQYTWGML